MYIPPQKNPSEAINYTSSGNCYNDKKWNKIQCVCLSLSLSILGLLFDLYFARCCYVNPSLRLYLYGVVGKYCLWNGFWNCMWQDEKKKQRGNKLDLERWNGHNCWNECRERDGLKHEGSEPSDITESSWTERLWASEMVYFRCVSSRSIRRYYFAEALQMPVSYWT